MRYFHQTRVNRKGYTVRSYRLDYILTGVLWLTAISMLIVHIATN